MDDIRDVEGKMSEETLSYRLKYERKISFEGEKSEKGIACMKHLSPWKFGTSTYQLFQGFWTFINRAEASRT